MPTWLIIVLVVLIVLAVGGAIAAKRRLAATHDRFEADLARPTATSRPPHAEDNGWERTRSRPPRAGSTPPSAAASPRTSSSSR